MRWSGALAVAVGCAQDEGSPPDPCASEDMTLAVGWGKDVYAPLADGDVVQMVHGPQGGWHVESAGEVRWSMREIGILPSLVDLETSRVLTTNALASFEAMGVYDEASCGGTFTNVEAFLSADGPGEPIQNICALAGREVELSIEITELLTGRTARDSAVVVLALDPIDEPVCP